LTAEERSRRLARIVAVTGAFAAVVWSLRVGGGIAVLALMLAVTTIVPLGLALVDSTSRFHRAAISLLPIDAACGALGWTAAPGDPIALACAGFHVALCTLAALHAVTRLLSRWRASRLGPARELAIDIGLFLLPIGAAWLFATRAGISPMGFQEPVVMFTAAHFHYAGFAAPIILGCVGRFTHGRAYAISVAVVCAGVPLTAIGISTTHEVEVVAAIFLACGMLVASAILVFRMTRVAWEISPIASALFALAGVALVGTMALAATFATTASAGRGASLQGALDVTTMLELHGAGNSLGFALAALVALTILDVRSATRRPTTPSATA
jgi:hypothetical protein